MYIENSMGESVHSQVDRIGWYKVQRFKQIYDWSGLEKIEFSI